ncbi:MAG TPA: hypothetical protein VHP33_00620 [Polyangiaceae bacterium]|nr:hypothetical protein [Polyangiaceae bacterium]
MVTVPMREQNARRFLGIAATLGVLGVAFNLGAGDENTLPKIMAAVGVAALIWSIHRFGRLGPDPMIVYEQPEEERAPRKKKKKKRKPVADETSSDDGM